ncbi:MAG: extracellular solute-binding protein, partial [Clostridiales bacterium]
MKKINSSRLPMIFLSFFLIMLLVLLTGCDNSAMPPGVTLDPQNPVSLRLWHYYNGPQKQALDKMVAEFNDTVGNEQGIIVEAFSHGSISDLTDQVLAAAVKKVGSEEIPEIFSAYADTVQQVDQIGLVADLAQYITWEELAEYVPNYVEEGKLGTQNSFKIFPVAKSTEIMILNKTDWTPFAKTTGATLESLSTMEGLVQTAKAYYEWTDAKTPAPDDGKAFWGRDSMANYFIIGCKQLGIEIFSVTDGVVTFNIDKEILRRLWDNYYVPSINGWFGAYGRFRSDDAKTGDILALVGSSSGSSYFPDHVTISDTESYPIESLILPAPLFAGGEKVAVQQGAGMVVTKSDANREYAASVFLKWLTETERNIRFSVSTGYLPVKIAANDSVKIAEIAKTLDDDGTLRKIMNSIPIAIKTIQENELYTNQAFSHGTEARKVLESSLSDFLAKDLEAVNTLVASGISRPDAAKQFATDQNFETWYGEFTIAL